MQRYSQVSFHHNHFPLKSSQKLKGSIFHQKTNVDSIIHLVGWSFGCHWCFWHLINVMPYRSSCCIQYQVILNDIFMAPGCMGHIHWVLIVDLVLHLSLLCCILRCITLTQWARVTHICVSKLAIMGSNNGLSPDQRQAIIWTNAGILLIQTLETNFSEISNEIHGFHLRRCIWKCHMQNGVHFVSVSMC